MRSFSQRQLLSLSAIRVAVIILRERVEGVQAFELVPQQFFL